MTKIGHFSKWNPLLQEAEAGSAEEQQMNEMSESHLLWYR